MIIMHLAIIIHVLVCTLILLVIILHGAHVYADSQCIKPQGDSSTVKP